MKQIKKKNELIKKIIHVDMDAFFAAVEQRDNPALRGKPVVVGGSKDGRGVVSTCSYEARKFGIHSAMPAAQAYRLCPQAIFVRGNYEAYKEASRIVREIFFEYTDLVEPVSIDEAYLDVTENKVGISSATIIAEQIRIKIFERTQLTASAGVSYNKFLAKIASDYNKPNGQCVIEPGKASEILDSLKIGKFHGVGKVTEKKMKELGIHNGKDLKKWGLQDLFNNFGKVGQYYYNIVRGIDHREVKTTHVRKSIGCERTFEEDIDDIEELKTKLSYCCEKVESVMKKNEVRGKTLTVKMKYSNFEVNSRSVSSYKLYTTKDELFYAAKNIFLQSFDQTRKLRLIGVSVSNLVWKNKDKTDQLTFDFYVYS